MLCVQAIIASTQQCSVSGGAPFLGSQRATVMKAAPEVPAANGRASAGPTAVLQPPVAARSAVRPGGGGTFRRSASARLSGEHTRADDWSRHPLRGAFAAVRCSAWQSSDSTCSTWETSVGTCDKLLRPQHWTLLWSLQSSC